MSKKGASYRIVLRNKDGKFSNIRHAQSYEIYYGKRKVLSRSPFPRYAAKSFTKETTAKKRKYLEKTVKTIEKKRLLVLEEARIKRAAKKQAELQKKSLKKEKAKKQKIQKVIEEPAEERPEPPKVHDAEKAERISIRSQHFDLMDREEIDWANAVEQDPVTLKNASVKDVLVIPYIPPNDDYTKELIEKTITTQEATEILELSILNFTMANHIVLNSDNFSGVAKYIFDYFIMHILEFFTDIVETKKEFILRIKFTHTIRDDENKEKQISQGISLRRQLITRPKRMITVLYETIKKFLGQFDEVRGKILHRNYLAGKKDLFITGFTLEAARRVNV